MLDDAWGGVYGLAIFTGQLEELLNDKRVRALHRDGTKLVFLNGEMPRHFFDGTGINALPHPFRTSDVVEMLNRLGFACPRLV